MMNFKHYIVLLACFAVCLNVAQAQNVPDSKIKRGTLWYYVHTIQKNETLSYLAQNYRVSIKEIREVNVSIIDIEKIREGQTILIPDYSAFIDKYPPDKWLFELYRVKPGDKLKSIAKTFDTEVKDIKNINPEIDNKPSPGSEIRVPVLRRVMAMADVSKNYSDDSKKIKGNPAVAFDWGNKNDSTDKLDKEEDKNCREFRHDPKKHVLNISILTPLKEHSGVAFTEGLLLAADELKNEGTNLILNFIDLSAEGRGDYLKNKSIEESNLIIALTDFEELKKLVEFSSEKEIPLIAPYQSKASSLIAGNQYFLQVYPSDNAIYAKLTENRFNRNEINPILIRAATADSVMLRNYRNAMKTRFGNFTEHEHTMGLRPGSTNLGSILSSEKLNLVFVCSNHEAFVSDLLDRLNVQKSSISVYGRSTWRDFKNIDRSKYFDLNLHLVQPFYVDYGKEHVKSFIGAYRQSYNGEPSQYAFLGYDVMSYFAAVLKKYGQKFLPCISDFSASFLQSHYRFEQIEKGGGYVNAGCFLLEYDSAEVEVKAK
ncbi:MAG: LysM peptidoglycan-binding domain-containing protein [Prevotellaceae bacterium]|jgi:LysM repeat protein|nr:LysM peptidoglycan-binding domain-containing protein [Prevotellaceae bacterium]